MTSAEDRVAAAVVAAREGLQAWDSFEFTRADRARYIDALRLVLANLDAVVAQRDLCDFLCHVLEAEIQTAPHIMADDERTGA